MKSIHGGISHQTQDILSMTKSLIDQQERLRVLNSYFCGFMRGEYEVKEYNEEFAQFLCKVVGNGLVESAQTPLLHFWIFTAIWRVGTCTGNTGNTSERVLYERAGKLIPGRASHGIRRER